MRARSATVGPAGGRPDGPAGWAATALGWCLSSPLKFGLLAMLVYGAALLPFLLRAHFDSSIFVVAGDRFVNAARLPVPIRVSSGTGFDGQFYYRMAMAPLRMTETAFGISFDAPALRMQRIFYPTLVWALSLGQASLVAPAMLAANLLGLGLLAAAAFRLARRLGAPGWCAPVIVFWPGFLLTLTHGTTEIWSATLLMAAMEAYLASNMLGLLLAGAAAPLARETGLLALGGLFCLALYDGVTSSECQPDRAALRRWRPALVLAVALLPFFVWQAILHRALGEGAVSSDVAANLGWPFRGMVASILTALDGSRPYVHNPLWQLVMRVFVTVSVTLLAGWSVAAVVKLPSAIRQPDPRAVAAAWMPLALLMILLAEPWLDPVNYLRAFTECFVFATFLVGFCWRSRHPGRLAAAGEACIWIGVWGMCFLALR